MLRGWDSRRNIWRRRRSCFNGWDSTVLIVGVGVDAILKWESSFCPLWQQTNKYCEQVIEITYWVSHPLLISENSLLLSRRLFGVKVKRINLQQLISQPIISLKPFNSLLDWYAWREVQIAQWPGGPLFRACRPFLAWGDREALGHVQVSQFSYAVEREKTNMWVW